jgi:integrase
MSVYKRERKLKNGSTSKSYFVKYYVPDPNCYNGKKQTTKNGFRKKMDAEAFDLQKKLEWKNGTIAHARNLTVGEYLDQYLSNMEAQDYSPNTLDGYRRNVEKDINPRIGRLPLSELKPQSIQNMYTDLLNRGGKNGSRLSPTTVIYCHRVLRRALKLAVNRQLISYNPCDRVTLPKTTKYNAKVYTVEQLETLFNLVDGTYLEAPVKIAGMIGLRLGELCGLKWSDIDLKKGMMHVQRSSVPNGKNIAGTSKESTGTKNARTRYIQMPKQLIDVLVKEQERHEKLRNTDGLLYDENDYICKYDNGARIPNGSLTIQCKRRIKQLTEEKGYPDIRFHDLRHSAATYMLEQGVPLDVVKDILGHSSISITSDTYGHILDKRRRSAAELMDKAFSHEEEKSTKD